MSGKLTAKPPGMLGFSFKTLCFVVKSFYGLGNLFFDQMNVSDYSRYEFLDRYVFYNGRLVSVDLLTAMLEDYARPGPMGAAERADFLGYIFQASGWLPRKNDGSQPGQPRLTLVGLP